MMYPYVVGHTLLPRFYVHVWELKNIYVYKIYNCAELVDTVAVRHRNHLVALASADFTHQHPSSARTYMNEDMMQVMKRVGMANRYAVPSHRRSLTVAERVCLGKGIQLFTENRQ